MGGGHPARQAHWASAALGVPPHAERTCPWSAQGQSETPNHVRDEGSFPPKRSPGGLGADRQSGADGGEGAPAVEAASCDNRAEIGVDLGAPSRT
jgi:hypothetical protein